MPLSDEQIDNIEKLIAPHLDALSKYADKPKRFQALKLALKPEPLNITEMVALSKWTDSDKVPMLPIVASLRGFQQSISEIEGITEENQTEARKYISDRIRTRIARLKKEKVIPAEIPNVSQAGMIAFGSCLTAYLADNVSKALEAIQKTSKEIIHSDDKRIRYAINYAIAASLSAFIKGTSDPGKEIVISAIGGAIGGAIVKAAGPKYANIANFAVDGAIGGATANIKKGISAAAIFGGIGAAVKAVTSLFTSHPDIPDFAEGAVNNYVNGAIINAIYATGQKAAYKMAWKAMKGKSSLEKRDMLNFLESYFISTGVSKIAGIAISEIGGEITAAIGGYINKQIPLTTDQNESKLLNSMSNRLNHGIDFSKIDFTQTDPDAFLAIQNVSSTLPAKKTRISSIPQPEFSISGSEIIPSSNNTLSITQQISPPPPNSGKDISSFLNPLALAAALHLGKRIFKSGKSAKTIQRNGNEAPKKGIKR